MYGAYKPRNYQNLTAKMPTGGNKMPYPIITPEFFREFADESKPENKDIVYNVLFTPASVEYVFPLNQDRVLRRLMDTKETLSYKMTTLSPEKEEEYAKKGRELVEQTPFLKHYWSIKTLTMFTLQNRTYDFPQRMLLLNFCYKSIQTMLDKFREDVIPKFVQDFIGKREHEDVIKYFSELKPLYPLSFGNGLAFIRALPAAGEFDKVRFGIYKNLGIRTDAKEFTFNEKQYTEMKKAFDEFLKGREHYIENVMVNYVWTFCMPFADYHSATLWENFIFFNTIYNAIKVMLTIYTYDKKDKDEAFFIAVKSFDDALRATNRNIVRSVVDANSEQGMVNNGDMALLSIS